MKKILCCILVASVFCCEKSSANENSRSLESMKNSIELLSWQLNLQNEMSKQSELKRDQSDQKYKETLKLKMEALRYLKDIMLFCKEKILDLVSLTNNSKKKDKKINIYNDYITILNNIFYFCDALFNSNLIKVDFEKQDESYKEYYQKKHNELITILTTLSKFYQSTETNETETIIDHNFLQDIGFLMKTLDSLSKN